ncbi:hypothetical protein CBS101457_004552 [Exobasidium rhododendri]|nr:hypothetical protein CBS101457_004552 [Exobasidium rhododendri]
MLLTLLSQSYFAVYLSLLGLWSPSVQHRALADRVLQKYPLIDQHVDLPVIYRILHRNDVGSVDYNGPLEGHVDLDRLKRGGSGGFFSIAYVPCYDSEVDSSNSTIVFNAPNNMVRDTIEQVDVTKQLVLQYPDSIALATSPAQVRKNFKSGKISHLIGIEGAHSLGNSLAALRMYFDLGVRYMTLTHTCHNPFADTSGSTEGVLKAPLHGGLSKFGERLVLEMNRIGMMVDLSHTADSTARQALSISKAPAFFSHSGARSIFNHTRNVPDDILESISERSGRDSFVGVPFLPDFVGKPATLELIADHVEHVSKIAGRSRVGIGSDFDGFPGPGIPGMEDVSHYRSLLTVLAKRGWSERQLAGLTGGNFLRIFEKVEATAKALSREGAIADTLPWSGRPDLKGGGWLG